HHEHKQVQVGEEAIEAEIAFHIAGGEDVNQEADKGDDEHHHQRELVDLVAPLDGEIGYLARFLPLGIMRASARKPYETAKVIVAKVGLGLIIRIEVTLIIKESAKRQQ